MSNHLGIGFPIDHEALGQSPMNLERIGELLHSCDWRGVLRNISILSALENYMGPRRSAEFQLAVWNKFIDRSGQNKILDAIQSGGVLFSELSAATLSLLTLQNAQTDRNGIIKAPPKKTFAEILLSTNDLLSSRFSNSSKYGADPYARSIGFSDGEPVYYKTVRYYHLFSEIVPSLKNAPGYRDISAMFQAATGIQLQRLYSFAFVIYAIYLKWCDNLQASLNQGWTITPTLVRERYNISLQEAFDLLKKFAIPEKEFSTLRQNATDPPFDFTVLRQYPLVHFGGNSFCVPVVSFLFSRLTLGAYFNILDSLSDNDEKRAFGQFWGNVVERYVHELLEYSLGSPGKQLSVWYRSDQLQKNRACRSSPDATIIGHRGSGLTVAFLEVKSTRPNRHILVTGNIASLRSHWINHLIRGQQDERGAVKQLDRTVEDFFNGNLVIPGVKADQVTCIFPVIITSDRWPILLDLNSVFLDDIKSEGLLQGDRIAPVDVWSCFDLELVVGLSQVGQSLFDFLTKRSMMVKDRLPLYLEINAAGLFPKGINFLDERWKSFGSAIKQDISLDCT